jgi:hypothetical protein
MPSSKQTEAETIIVKVDFATMNRDVKVVDLTKSNSNEIFANKIRIFVNENRRFVWVVCKVSGWKMNFDC